MIKSCLKWRLFFEFHRRCRLGASELRGQRRIIVYSTLSDVPPSISCRPQASNELNRRLSLLLLLSRFLRFLRTQKPHPHTSHNPRPYEFVLLTLIIKHRSSALKRYALDIRGVNIAMWLRARHRKATAIDRKGKNKDMKG
jgi:hypothetical protein